jgi:D-alanyl-D-alanine carboxypeptidase
MKLLYKYFWLLIFPIIMSCNKTEIGHTGECSPISPDTSSIHPKAAAYQSLLNDYVNKGLPGAILLIHDVNGLWMGAAGYSDIDKGIPMSPCVVSKIASVTKMYIGVLFMQLSEQGLIELDAKVSEYLPDDRIKKVRNASESTIRQLLNHTSGIYDIITGSDFYLSVLNDPPHKWEPDDLMEFAKNKDPYFEPGADCHYSNTNFLLLSMILDEITGHPHCDLMRQNIFQPLGLINTYYYWHDPLPAYTAQGYFDLYHNETICNVTNYNTGSGNGYGGIYTNVYEMMTFIEALLVSKTLISQESLDEMLTFDQPLEPETYRYTGLGIYKDFIDRPDSTEFSYGHRGRDLGYSADLDWFPKNGTTMALIVNYGTDGESSLKSVFKELRLKIADEIFNETF